MKILILGGYGSFGGRLAELLLDMAGLEMLIAGRSFDNAEMFCNAHTGKALLRPLRVDRADIGMALEQEKPDLLVDASGPFQSYGHRPYAAAQACIAQHVDYLDLADSADFVAGFKMLDPAAKASDIFALSGVSSFPVLTAAVLREVTNDMTVKNVTGGIAPSPYAGVGPNVMRAVMSYAGSPVPLVRNGEPSVGTGLAESIRYTIAPPGHLPLRNIRFSLVDVPDLQLLPPAYPGLLDIWMGAGPVPEYLHRTLNLLAKTRAKLGLSAMTPLAPLFYRVLNRLRYGEHRGGMFIEAKGEVTGQSTERSWHLIAEGDDGPYIPSMACEIIIRKLMAGTRPMPGARAATNEISLGDYENIFEKRAVFTGWRDEDRMAQKSLYEQLLGNAYEKLPRAVRQLHGSRKRRRWSGRAKVIRGRNPLGVLVAWLIGFPPPSDDVDVDVSFTPDTEGEFWERNFGGRRFGSYQIAGKGKDDRLLVERFGPISVALALVVQQDRLLVIPRNWRIGPIPLPRALLPFGETYESEQDGRFHFNVSISAPIIGLVAEYRGWLSPA